METTVYDVYTDVDGVEELLGSCDSISKVKTVIANANENYPDIIMRSNIFNEAVNIGSIERSANVRIEPRMEIM